MPAQPFQLVAQFTARLQITAIFTNLLIRPKISWGPKKVQKKLVGPERLSEETSRPTTFVVVLNWRLVGGRKFELVVVVVVELAPTAAGPMPLRQSCQHRPRSYCCVVGPGLLFADWLMEILNLYRFIAAESCVAGGRGRILSRGRWSAGVYGS